MNPSSTPSVQGTFRWLPLSFRWLLKGEKSGHRLMRVNTVPCTKLRPEESATARWAATVASSAKLVTSLGVKVQNFEVRKDLYNLHNRSYGESIKITFSLTNLFASLGSSCRLRAALMLREEAPECGLNQSPSP